MQLKTKFDPARAQAAHENTILASAILPEGMKGPFGHAWGCLETPGVMDSHKHPTEELYIFIRGNGFVVVDGEEISAEPGDVIRIPPNAMHSVINRENSELLWAAFWWSPME